MEKHYKHPRSEITRTRKFEFNAYGGNGQTPLDIFTNNKAEGFIPVPSNDIILYLECFDTNHDVIQASTIATKMMFSGGIQFERKDFTIEDAAQKVHSERWKAWAESMWRYLDCCKFAAAVVDPHDDEIPLCLRLESIDILIKQTAMGTNQFKYFTRGAPGVAPKEIPNVHTFYLNGNILNTKGQLCSRMAAIIPETELYVFKTLMTKIADYSRANPCLITEVVPDKHDSDTLPNLPQTAEIHGNGYAPQSRNNNNTNNANFTDLGGGGLGSSDKSRIPYHPGGLAAIGGYNNKHVTPTHENYSKALDLPEGRKLVTGPIAEAPTDLLSIKTANKEDIFLTWGLPLSLISNSASSGSMRNNTGQKGKGGGSSNSGSGSNARWIFQAYQQDMKNFSIGMVQMMYNAIYLKKHYKQVKEKYSEQSKKIDTTNMHEYVKEIFVEVSIPGQPNDEILRELLMLGAVKYEYYKKITAARYGIPLEAFNDKLELTIQEMNGIVEKDDSSAPPAAKKSKT